MRDFAPAAMVPSARSTERRSCTGPFLLSAARPRAMARSGRRPLRLQGGALSAECRALHVGGPAVVTAEMDSADGLGQLVEGFHAADAVQGHAVRPALNLDPDNSIAVFRVLAKQLAERARLDRVVRVVPDHARGGGSDDVVKATATLIEISRRFDDERIEVVRDVGSSRRERIVARAPVPWTYHDGRCSESAVAHRTPGRGPPPPGLPDDLCRHPRRQR